MIKDDKRLQSASISPHLVKSPLSALSPGICTHLADEAMGQFRKEWPLFNGIV